VSNNGASDPADGRALPPVREVHGTYARPRSSAKFTHSRPGRSKLNRDDAMRAGVESVWASPETGLVFVWRGRPTRRRSSGGSSPEWGSPSPSLATASGATRPTPGWSTWARLRATPRRTSRTPAAGTAVPSAGRRSFRRSTTTRRATGSIYISRYCSSESYPSILNKRLKII
jgi:hypothetical protein